MLSNHQKNFILNNYKEYDVHQLANLTGLKYSQVSNYLSWKQLPRKKNRKTKEEAKKRHVFDGVYKTEERINYTGNKRRIKVVA